MGRNGLCEIFHVCIYVQLENSFYSITDTEANENVWICFQPGQQRSVSPILDFS